MSISKFKEKEPLRREHRLNACIASGGILADMNNRKYAKSGKYNNPLTPGFVVGSSLD